MGLLTVDEVIARCERKCASLYKYKDSLPTEINNQIVNLEYWEHYHVREWLKELQQYRAIGLTPDQIQEIDKLYKEKCEELAKADERIDEGMDEGMDIIITAVNLIYDLLNEIDVNDLEYMSHIDLAEQWVQIMNSDIVEETLVKGKLLEYIVKTATE